MRYALYISLQYDNYTVIMVIIIVIYRLSARIIKKV